MVLSGFLFLSVRVWEIIITVPIVGMLGWLVHVFVHANLLTPTYILLLFIVATLALAWEIFTVISYLRARHDALFIAFTDLCFLGAFIAGVVVLRFVTKYNCSSVGPVWTPQHGGVSYSSDPSKVCAVLKASFAFGIIDILNFAVTFVSLTNPIDLEGSNANAALVPRPPCVSPPPQRRSSGGQARIFSLIATQLST